MQDSPAPQGMPACASPLYYNGSPISGCVMLLNGPAVPVCWVDNAGWQECPVPPGTDPQQAHQAVMGPAAPRTTLTGEQCLLPTVIQVPKPDDIVQWLSSALCCLHARRMQITVREARDHYYSRSW